MNEYIHDINHLNKRWGREAIMGNVAKWMTHQISYVNNPDKYGNMFVNQYPEPMEAVKELQSYELECQKQQYYIGIEYIKKLFNEYIHDINHLNKRWDRKAIMGNDLAKWMQISYVNNPDKYGNMFVNQHPRLIEAVKELQSYELECQKQQYYIGIEYIKKLFNEYIHDINHLNKRWDRKAIMGNDLTKWMKNQISYVNNLDKYGNMLINQHPRLIEAVKDLQEYELECQKQQYYIGIEHIKKLMNEYIHDINHLNKRCGREAIMGYDLKSWMDNQISYVNNPDDNGNMFVNQHPRLIEAVKELQEYELESKKNFKN